MVKKGHISLVQVPLKIPKWSLKQLNELDIQLQLTLTIPNVVLIINVMLE